MKVKKYRVQLMEEEQQELRAPVSKGRAAAYKQTQARILLLRTMRTRSLKVGTAKVGTAKVGTAMRTRLRAP